MKFKKAIYISVLFIFLSMYLSACNSEDNLSTKEKLINSFENTLELDSYTFTSEASLNIDFPESAYSDPFFSGFASFLSDAKLNIEGKYEKTKQDMKINLTAGKDRGLFLDFNTHLFNEDEETFYIQIPEGFLFVPEEIQGKYIKFNANELAGYDMNNAFYNFDEQKQIEYAKKMLDIIIEHYEDYFVEINVKDVNTDLKLKDAIKFEVTNENIVDILEILYKDAIVDIFNAIDYEDIESDGTLTKKDFELLKGSLSIEVENIKREDLESIHEYIDINDISLIFGTNKDGIIVYQEIIIDFDVKDESPIGIKLLFNQTLSDINKTRVEINTEDKEIIPLYELENYLNLMYETAY